MNSYASCFEEYRTFVPTLSFPLQDILPLFDQCHVSLPSSAVIACTQKHPLPYQKQIYCRVNVYWYYIPPQNEVNRPSIFVIIFFIKLF